ncbi:hypothetical protein DL546_000073 [Coniochaeta pulveracea]|uniref:Uncharacterized protein n=1 Tax=Coniochaeta pulveracea TaxID=177199 RepID=A0A420YII6_9PEZI|nr:hypothetical protein DL546_000073 [Coniochaeta pulveracea]
MSFLGEIVDVIADGAAEDAGAGAGEAAGSGVASASEVINSIDIGAGVGDAGEASGNIEADVQDGMEESQNEMRDAVQNLEDGAPGAAEDAQALENGWAQKFKNVWASAKTFGSFAGVELVKGALFYAGMKVLQNAFEKPAASSGSSTGGSTTNSQATNIVLTINKAGQILQEAQDSWTKWQAAHYDDRASYGSISVAGFDLQLFQVLQNGISSLGDQRDKLTPLVKKAQASKTLDDVKALLTADIAYAKAVFDLSTQISSKMTAMTDAGLPTKSAEVQAAYSMLVAASA